MKSVCKKLRWMVVGFAVLLGCTSDKVRDFIPGVYVNTAGGEFSVASDTLVVELLEGNNYMVFRRTGFNLITDGKLGRREHETEKWNAVYSNQTQCLTEVRRGKMICFYPDKGCLTVGKREYKKKN